jgi:membrane protein implicated in regulation of membrane protease activity
MLTIYLACLVFGGIILGVSMFAATDADGGTPGGDVDFEGGEATDAGHVDGEGVAEAVRFFSLRNVVLFVAFFGLTGSLLTLVGIPGLLVFPTAVVMGFFAALFAFYLLRYVARTESGTNPTPRLDGLRGRVVIPVSRTHRGKIAVDTGDQYLQVLARVAEEASAEAFFAGQMVTIVRFEDGTAMVAEENFIG